MATRYSKRRDDGTVAYYDTEEQMLAANPEPGLFDFSGFWAFIGFAVFTFVGCILIYMLNLGDSWPKWLRFAAVLIFGSIGAFVVGRLGQFLLQLFCLILCLAILGLIGRAIWHFV